MGYNSIPICWVVIVFMFFSGCNLALFYRFITTFNFKLIFKNEEFKVYVGLIILVSLAIFGILIFNNQQFSIKTLTDSIFTTLSIMTSTGFISCDYSMWPIAAQVFLFIVIIFGSSAGSTGGGIKIVRALIIFKYLKRELIKLLHPNAVVTIKMNNQTVSTDIISQIIAFVMFYIAIFFIGGLIVSIAESNFVIGFAGSIATLNLIGPSFGHIIGATGNYDSLSLITKIVFMFNMIVGRLELVPFLILLNKDFWTIKK
jgi:trk system potassium uptake protein TrkH